MVLRGISWYCMIYVVWYFMILGCIDTIEVILSDCRDTIEWYVMVLTQDSWVTLILYNSAVQSVVGIWRLDMAIKSFLSVKANVNGGEYLKEFPEKILIHQQIWGFPTLWLLPLRRLMRLTAFVNKKYKVWKLGIEKFKSFLLPTCHSEKSRRMKLLKLFSST